ncbi:MAG: hypothetical protein ABIR79_01705 [Candidatus Binatia bacterium]
MPAPPTWHEWGDPWLDAPPAPVVAVSLVGHAPSADERRVVLARLHTQTAPQTLLIVADHNRPRRRSTAFGALLGAPRVPGWSLGARWRRLAEPTAREVQAAGFRVLHLALVAGERVQLVMARRAGP